MKKILLSAVLFLTLLSSYNKTFAHDKDLTLQEIVHFSDAIVIGRVVATHGFDAGGGMVGTEVVFQELDVITSREAADPYLGKDMKLRFAGGTFGNKTVSACCQPRFEIGKDYLVCTLLDGKTYLPLFQAERKDCSRFFKMNLERCIQ